MTAPTLAAPSPEDAAHLRAIRRSDYRHLLHDADPDSTVPAFVVSLAKTPRAVTR